MNFQKQINDFLQKHLVSPHVAYNLDKLKKEIVPIEDRMQKDFSNSTEGSNFNYFYSRMDLQLSKIFRVVKDNVQYQFTANDVSGELIALLHTDNYTLLPHNLKIWITDKNFTRSEFEQKHIGYQDQFTKECGYKTIYNMQSKLNPIVYSYFFDTPKILEDYNPLFNTEKEKFDTYRNVINQRNLWAKALYKIGTYENYTQKSIEWCNQIYKNEAYLKDGSNFGMRTTIANLLTHVLEPFIIDKNYSEFFKYLNQLDEKARKATYLKIVDQIFKYKIEVDASQIIKNLKEQKYIDYFYKKVFKSGNDKYVVNLNANEFNNFLKTTNINHLFFSHYSTADSANYFIKQLNYLKTIGIEEERLVDLLNTHINIDGILDGLNKTSTEKEHYLVLIETIINIFPTNIDMIETSWQQAKRHYSNTYHIKIEEMFLKHRSKEFLNKKRNVL